MRPDDLLAGIREPLDSTQVVSELTAFTMVIPFVFEGSTVSRPPEVGGSDLAAAFVEYRNGHYGVGYSAVHRQQPNQRLRSGKGAFANEPDSLDAQSATPAPSSRINHVRQLRDRAQRRNAKERNARHQEVSRCHEIPERKLLSKLSPHDCRV